MPDQPTAPAWTIIQQTPTSDLGPAGSYVSGVKVTFRTALGVTASVFIADTDYTAPAVHAAVSARAAIADQVAGLQG